MIKRLTLIGLVMVMAGFFILNEDYFYNLYKKIRINQNDEIVLNKNEYYINNDFIFLKNTDDFIAKNNQDLINIFYTIINSGTDRGKFYCSPDYSNCVNDVVNLAQDEDLLTYINNYVHPFNSFQHIEIETNSLGDVNVLTTKNYDNDTINQINSKVDEIMLQMNEKNYSNDYDKIKFIHNYIISNSKYDKEKKPSGKSVYHSDLASGPLLEGYGICSGYTDAMAIFLDKLGIENYKISSNNHIWNALYFNNNWYHVDLTWDDPIINNGRDVLLDDFFMINTSDLLSKDSTEHTFAKEIYPEMK